VCNTVNSSILTILGSFSECCRTTDGDQLHKLTRPQSSLYSMTEEDTPMNVGVTKRGRQTRKAARACACKSEMLRSS
jgi:hypothetical protein